MKARWVDHTAARTSDLLCCACCRPHSCCAASSTNMPTKCACARAALNLNSSQFRLRTEAIDVLDRLLPSMQGEGEPSLKLLLALLKRGCEKVELEVTAEKERLDIEAKEIREAELAAERAAKEYAAAKAKAEKEAARAAAEEQAKREAEARAKAKAEAEAAAKARKEAEAKAAAEAAAKAKAEKEAARLQAAEEKAAADALKVEAKAAAKAEAEAARALEEANAEISRQIKQYEAEARAIQKAANEARTAAEREEEARQAAEAVAKAKEERAAAKKRAAQEKAVADQARAEMAARSKAAKAEATKAAEEAARAARAERDAATAAQEVMRAEAAEKAKAAKEAERAAAAAEIAERKLAAEHAKADAERQKAEAAAIAKEELAHAREAAAAADQPQSTADPPQSSSPRSSATNVAQQRLERAQARMSGLRRSTHTSKEVPEGQHTKQVFLSGTRSAARRAYSAEDSHDGGVVIEPILDVLPASYSKAAIARKQLWKEGASRSAELSAEINLSGDCVALDADDDTLVSIGGDGSGTSVSIYSIKRSIMVEHLQGHTDLVTCVASQGDLIVSAGRDKMIRLWSKKKAKCVAIFEGCEHTVYGLAVRGDTLASGEGSSKAIGIVRLWNIKTANSMCSLLEHSGTVWSIALGDEFAASASFDMTAKVWAANASDGASSLATLPHPNWVFSISMEGNLVATGCGDRNVRLWSLSNFACLRTFAHGVGSASAPGAVAVSNLIFSVRLADNLLVSGSECGRLCVWSIAGDGECCTTLNHGAAIKGLAISKKGSFVASAGGNLKKLVIWRPLGASR